jgi:choline kinase
VHSLLPDIRRAVILAAGDGGRMLGHTRTLPKPLVRLSGHSIIDYTLRALADAGISEALVVTGYRESQLRQALAGHSSGLRLEFVTNPRFQQGASFSLAAAREWCGDDPFLLVMADHVLSAELVHRLRAAASGAPERSFVASDAGPRDDAFSDEATKVQFGADGRVTAIGKSLPAWDGLDAGAFTLTPAVWQAVDASPADCELSRIMSEFARRGGLFAADITGAPWYDIDTEDDLAAAATVVAGR